jgi:NhaP-type Na+/H+ or K+/H+ antiporter
MALDFVQIVLGIMLMYLGYSIARRTSSEQISIMGYVVLVLGIVLIANGIGIVSLFPTRS